MKRIIYICCFVVFTFGCSDTTDDGPIIRAGQDPLIGVQLVFPQEASLCNEGTNPTLNESTVFFEWEPNNNAESYTLTIENLDTGNVTQYETIDFIFSVTIARATAFRWFVTYNYQNEIEQSAIWNFYNAGSGAQTYAPFPAEIISPSMAQTIPATSSVTLEWSGSDVDNDIVAYDVYFGTNNEPNINSTNITVTELEFSVVPNTIYYWNIVTKDAEGNTSESGVYQFRISE